MNIAKALLVAQKVDEMLHLAELIAKGNTFSTTLFIYVGSP